MRVAIAGAGNVGRSIARELLSNGHEVLLIDKDPKAMKMESVPDAEWLLADACEIARELKAHALTRVHRVFLADLEAVEEIGDRHFENARDLVKAPRRDAVDTALVLMGLLIGHADHLRQLLLRQAQHDPAFANAVADMAVGRRGARGDLRARPVFRFVFGILAMRLFAHVSNPPAMAR